MEDEDSGYMFYKIYSGNLSFEMKDREGVRKLDGITALSCTGHEFIRYFSEIPQSITLTTQLTLFEFEQYMQKVLLSEHALNYLVLPLWLDCPTPLASKNYFKTNNCVASMQYSKRCKLFVFPKDFLRLDWLTTLNFYIVHSTHNQVELVGFVVLKLIECTSYEVSIIPEKNAIEKNSKAFKLIRSQNEVIEKTMDMSILDEKRNLDCMNGTTCNGTSSTGYDQHLISNNRPSTQRLFEDLIDNNHHASLGSGFVGNGNSSNTNGNNYQGSNNNFNKNYINNGKNSGIAGGMNANQYNNNGNYQNNKKWFNNNTNAGNGGNNGGAHFNKNNKNKFQNKLQRLMAPDLQADLAGVGNANGEQFKNGEKREKNCNDDNESYEDSGNSNQLFADDDQFNGFSSGDKYHNQKQNKAGNFENDLLGTLKMGYMNSSSNNGRPGNNLPNIHQQHHYNNYNKKQEQFGNNNL